MSSSGMACDTLALSSLKGVGPRTLEHLAHLDIHSVEDLLFHLPLRYEDRTRITPIGDLRPNDRALIQGQVRSSKMLFGRRASLLVELQDGTGVISLRFFHFTAAQRDRIAQPGLSLQCFGEARFSYTRGLEIVHPEYRQLGEEVPLDLAEHLTAVYPTTKGLNQVMWRKLMAQALEYAQQGEVLTELLPVSLLHTLKMPSLYEALHYVHEPPPNAALAQMEKGVHPAQQRLVFEELLAQHLSMQSIRQQTRQHQGLSFSGSSSLQAALQAQLPFVLTAAQKRVVKEVSQDYASNRPMLRLVQGDVGSGKTVIAALAACPVLEAGYQVAIMAPTELLAEQHYQAFNDWFQPLGIKVGWLSGHLSVAERRPLLAQIAGGELGVVVGTHALFQETVLFHRLALCVVDEQHRFGVQQRLALKEKGAAEGVHPHQLIMTATPIPRTLAMTAYADLDCSVIDELPPGRQPISTVLVSNQRRDDVIKRVEKSCQGQRQAYWVCTLVEESEVLECQAAEVTAEELRNSLSGLRIGLVHGRMKPAEKERNMREFKQQNIDLLVATTVVEVGVDVPNASLMIIENPERLGLAQLHQLRGRIGRGSVASHCVLLYQSPLSQNARRRLELMKRTQNGFEIAEEDLKMRGPGEFLGTRQTGLMQFRIANIVRDQHLLPKVHAFSKRLLAEYPSVSPRIIQRWVGNRKRYAEV